MKLNILLLILLYSSTLFAQDRVLVSEGSIKIGGLGEENLYFGFAADDKIIFTFSEINGKEIKEVEILEYPSSSRYTDFKTAAAKEKIITVNKEGVYKFRFHNGAVLKRVCRYTIERIPATEETKKFNTTVEWITKSDTSWNTYTKNVIVGYDTTFIPQTKKEVVSKELTEELLMDKTERVHSETNSNGNKSYVFFTLPQNTKSEYETKTVIAWAYWVGVGEEASATWQQNVKAVAPIAKTIAQTAYGPLGALAVGAVSSLMTPTTGEDVYYALTDQQNKNLFMGGQEYYISDKGKGVAGYKKFTDNDMCQGTHYICLYNDNSFLGIDATIKVSAIVETIKYEDREYKIPIVTPRLEKQIFSDPVINTYTLPVVVK